MAEIKPIRPNPIGQTFADWLYSGRDFANKAELPYLGGIGDLLFGESPEVIEDWAYGFQPYSGAGQTTQLDPRMVDVAGLPLPYAGAYYGAKGLYKGAQKLDDALGKITPTPDDYGFQSVKDVQGVRDYGRRPEELSYKAELDAPRFAGNANPEETVTLYRATSPTTKFEDVFDVDGLSEYKRPEGMVGDRYTDDYDYADYFRESYGPDATIEKIEVPKSVAEKGFIGEGEYIIDKNKFAPHVGEQINEGRRQFMKNVGLGTAGVVAATKSPAFLESVLKGVGNDAGRVAATTTGRSFVTTPLGKAIAYFKVYPELVSHLKEGGWDSVRKELDRIGAPDISGYDNMNPEFLTKVLGSKVERWSDWDDLSPAASETLEYTTKWIDHFGFDRYDDLLDIAVDSGIPPKTLYKELLDKKMIDMDDYNKLMKDFSDHAEGLKEYIRRSERGGLKVDFGYPETHWEMLE